MTRLTTLINRAQVSLPPITTPITPVVTGNDAWTGDPRTWGYDAFTGPRVTTFSQTLQAPLFVYPTSGSLPSIAGAIRGNLTAVRVNPVVTWDPSMRSKSTDNPGAVNVDNMALTITDSYLSCTGLRGSAGTGVQVPINYSIIDNTQTPSDMQGCIYSYLTVNIFRSHIIAAQDGLWIGDYTNAVATARFSAGNFTNPFGSQVQYSWIQQNNTTFGYNTITPGKYNPAGVQQTQTITWPTLASGSTAAGTFQLAWNAVKTSNIAWNASPSDVVSALTALTALNGVSLTVTGSVSAGSIAVTFPSLSPMYALSIYSAITYTTAGVTTTQTATATVLDPSIYPVAPNQVAGWCAKPATPDQISGAIYASISAPVSASVGSFVKPPPGVNGAYSGSGVFGGLYQVIGSTGVDRSSSAAVSIGVDYQRTTNGSTVTQIGWPQSTTLLVPFVSGTAIMVYLGGSNHSDESQMSRCNGRIWWYRCKLDSFGNSGAFICQPTIAPVSGASVYDPTIFPTSYLRVEECDIIYQPGRSKLAYISGSRLADPYTGVVDYPAYGFKAAPYWVTFKNCYIGNSDGTAIGTSQKIAYNSKGQQQPIVSSESIRFTYVMNQLDATGVALVSAANGGSLPTGDQLAADSGAAGGLRATLIKAEYQGHIICPTDGYSGTTDVITGSAVFQSRLTAKLSKAYLDARTWIVWENILDRTSGAIVNPTVSVSTINVRPWLKSDLSDGGWFIPPNGMS